MKTSGCYADQIGIHVFTDWIRMIGNKYKNPIPRITRKVNQIDLCRGEDQELK